VEAVTWLHWVGIVANVLVLALIIWDFKQILKGQ